MQIALTSDSHGSLDRLSSLLHNLQEGGVNHLLHAGDFVAPGVELLFQKFPQIQITIAQGNADLDIETLKKVKKLAHVQLSPCPQVKIGDLNFVLSHVEGIAQSQTKDAHVYCHGHTHRPKVEIRDSRLILNPGALCEDGRYFLLDLTSLRIIPKIFSEEI